MSFEFLKIEQSVYGEDVSLIGPESEDGKACSGTENM